MANKFILDACCGGRMIWLQKNQPNTLFVDKRKLDKGEYGPRPNFNITPDEIQDFTNLPYPDKSFKLIVWDPPFVKRRTRGTSYISVKYDMFVGDEWKETLKKGFEELWRVLDDYGVMEFKFANESIKFQEVLDLFHTQPLFGTTTRRNDQIETRWFCFMKIPEGEKEIS